jgi:uncharacterized protein (TIGR03086 family)
MTTKRGARTDLRALDRLAVHETLRLLKSAGPKDWARPTPCAGWDLRRLVAHMTGQHHGFAAAAAGGNAGADLSLWAERPLGEDPVHTYRASADAVLAAFAPDDVLTRTFLLPELSTDRTFPAPVAIGFHFLDYVVHAWDVARTLDVELHLDTPTAEAALALARRVPDDERRLDAAAPFRPALDAGGATGPLALTVAALGREPDWKPERKP